MICCNCQKALECKILRDLHSMSKDFSINECKYYDAALRYTYRKIAENDQLMRLIYDYFTGQVEGNYTEEQTKRAITSALWNL